MQVRKDAFKLEILIGIHLITFIAHDQYTNSMIRVTSSPPKIVK